MMFPVTGNPVLRSTTPADQPFLRLLYRTTRELELAGVPWTEAQKTAFCDMQFNAQSASYLQTYPQAEHLVVSTAEGVSAGRVIKARLESALQLVDISLLPAYRRQGWGGSIIGSLQHEAGKLNIPVWLSVEKQNPALALYRRLGFSITGDQDVRFTMAWMP